MSNSIQGYSHGSSETGRLE